MRQKSEKLEKFNEIEALLAKLDQRKSSIRFQKEDDLYNLITLMLKELAAFLLNDDVEEARSHARGIARISGEGTIFHKLKMYDEIMQVIAPI